MPRAKKTLGERLAAGVPAALRELSRVQRALLRKAQDALGDDVVVRVSWVHSHAFQITLEKPPVAPQLYRAYEIQIMHQSLYAAAFLVSSQINELERLGQLPNDLIEEHARRIIENWAKAD